MFSGFGGIFLSWELPSPEKQKACITKSAGFNYDPQFLGASSSKSHHHQHHQQQDEEEGKRSLLSSHGFSINRSRVLVGSGADAFRVARSALLSWRHFGLGWAFVDPKTPVETGVRFCVCVKEFLPWIMMPLQVAYVANIPDAMAVPSRGTKASFAFGSGTLHGHLLAGEERFSVEWDENDQVWYEIFSFSKPVHLLSIIGYPYVQFRQRYFTQKSTEAVLKHVVAQKSTAK